jgi:plasmid maintenance system antidote protein VapI
MIKNIVNLLCNGFEKMTAPALGNHKHRIASDCGLSDEDFQLVLDGEMEISPALALKLEQTMGVDAHDILAAQATDQLAALGKKRTQKVEVPAKTATAPKAETRKAADGRPKQSPMYGSAKKTGAIAVKL